MNLFCSFNFVKGNETGFGNTMIWTDEALPLPISEITNIERKISHECNFDNTVLLNFQPLRSDEE